MATTKILFYFLQDRPLRRRRKPAKPATYNVCKVGDRRLRSKSLSVSQLFHGPAPRRARALRSPLNSFRLGTGRFVDKEARLIPVLVILGNMFT